MKCIACDKDLSDRESKAKDAEGNYLDLCGECLPESQQAVYEAHAATDWQDEGIEVEEDTRSDEEYWEDFMALHWDNLVESWQDGLGLISPTERVYHLYDRAQADFLAELAAGTPRPLAAELGIKAPWTIDRDKVHVIT